MAACSRRISVVLYTYDVIERTKQLTSGHAMSRKALQNATNHVVMCRVYCWEGQMATMVTLGWRRCTLQLG